MDAHTKLTYGVDNKLSKIDTLIADARPAREAGKVSLESHGFTLEPQKTSLRTRDFFDVESGIVEKVYYAEMRAAVRRATGADEVLILEHIVRDAGAADTRGAKNPFASGGNGINGYAGVVHTDFRQDRAYQLARSKGSGKKEFGSSQRDRQRFMIVNTWRNISDEHLIYDNTLALCDGKTVDERALLPCDVHHPNGKSSEQYRLDAASAEAARWYYFPHMAKDEVLGARTEPESCPQPGSSPLKVSGAIQRPLCPAVTAPLTKAFGSPSVWLPTLYMYLAASDLQAVRLRPEGPRALLLPHGLSRSRHPQGCAHAAVVRGAVHRALQRRHDGAAARRAQPER